MSHVFEIRLFNVPIILYHVSISGLGSLIIVTYSIAESEKSETLEEWNERQTIATIT